MTWLQRTLGIGLAATASALALTAPAAASPFKNGYVGEFSTQQECEANRAANTDPSDPSVVGFPCFFASSQSQLSLAPQDWSGPGWYWRIRIDLA
jgi:hypothetical protein